MTEAIDVFKIHVRRAAGRGFPIFTCKYVWLCLSVCTPPFGPTEKRYRPEILYTHSPRPYLEMGFLLFFEKKNDPEDH